MPVCTSCWPGSTLSSKSVCVTHHSAGPKSTSLESLTCALPVTPWTPGLMTLLRFGCCYRNNMALEQRLHKNDLFFVETAFSSNNRILEFSLWNPDIQFLTCTFYRMLSFVHTRAGSSKHCAGQDPLGGSEDPDGPVHLWRSHRQRV